MFISLRVLSKSSKTCYFHRVSTLLLSAAMVSMSHIYCLKIARLYWFCLIRTGDVQFGSNLSKFRCKNLKASLMSFTCTLFSDKGHCFNQSERALYGNFIITINNELYEKVVRFPILYRISYTIQNLESRVCFKEHFLIFFVNIYCFHDIVFLIRSLLISFFYTSNLYHFVNESRK